jgi:hypothetical protein
MISIDLVGRLGNQMFEYATCRSIAERLGFNYFIFNYENSEIKNLFDTPQGIRDNNITNIFNDEKFNYVVEDTNDYITHVTSEIFNIKDNTKLLGIFPKSVYFDYNYQNIKNWFQPKNYNISLFDDCVKRYPYDEYCYIHFRGSDFLNINGYNLPQEYYNQAKLFFTGLKFVIVTDDLVNARRFFSEDDIISNDYMTDFTILMNSKFIIRNFSTFSWWVSYLGNESKKIVAPLGMFSGWQKKSRHFFPENYVIYI